MLYQVPDTSLNHSRTTTHSVLDVADDATVQTGNCTGSRAAIATTQYTAPWVTVGNAYSLSAVRPPPKPSRISLISNNPYSALDFDDHSIAVDTGASDNFGIASGTTNLHCRGITLLSATGDTRTSIGTDSFAIPLTNKACEFHAFRKGDIHRPLLSVGKACDEGIDEVRFQQTHCSFLKDGEEVLRGYRDPATRLYLLLRGSKTTDNIPGPARRASRGTRDDTALRDSTNHAYHGLNTHQPVGLGLPQQPSVTALNAYAQRSTPKLMQFLHACAGFPTIATWTQAIDRGYYLGWPGLTASRVRKWLPDSEETVLGHQQLVRQGIRSTSKGDIPSKETGTTSKGDETGTTSKGDGNKPTSVTMGKQRRVIACSVPTAELKGIMGTDQTGRFPNTSDRGHKYMFILADVDTDYIHGVPIKSKKAGELVRAFVEAHDALTACGFEPILHRIDHETSKDLVNAIKERQLTYEVMPPSNHRQNPAERAIATYKSHFISIINGLDKGYPPGGWDLLIPQVNMTLNMLRTCPVNPVHSAYSYVHGAYDFSAHPLAPLGCKAIVHQRRIHNGGTRPSWGNKGKTGYYLGPAMDSYRVWRFYMPDTGRVQETDTAKFLPKYAVPCVSSAERITESLDAIKEAIVDPAPMHTDISENQRLCAVIDRLKRMYEIADDTNGAPRTGIEPTTAIPSPGAEQAATRTINTTRGGHKQLHRIGTRVKVSESKDGKRVKYYGTATSFDPATGLYYVKFDDGEFEEFTNNEMKVFRIGANAPRTAHYADDVVRFGSQTIYPIRHGLNAGSIWDDELHKWMAYRDLIKHPKPAIRERWRKAGVNEFARLAQGYEDTEGLDVVRFIARRAMPAGKKATYARYVVDYRPEKDEPWRLRITCGGDKLEYYGETTTHSASMETIKCQLNNIISSIGSRCATADISNMYLESLLPEAEYVRFRLDLIPDAIIQAYKLHELATDDGYVYAEINKAWYGLKQAGRIAHDDLVKRLEGGGYVKVPHVEGYFKHVSRDIDFCLVVDDFLIRYKDSADLEHLCATVRQHYKFKVDEDAKQFVGINLRWNYTDRTVRLSMDDYVAQALSEFQHSMPKVPYHAPSKYVAPAYGQRVQYAAVDESSLLAPGKIKFIQQVIGKLLYYARAVDPTMLHAINDISIKTARGTEATLKATVHILNYAATHPNTEIIYRASDMILRVDSDAAYLVAPEARSRAGGFHYLSDSKGTVFNGPVLILAKVIKNVMASAAEAEIGALYMNAQEAAGLRTCLEAMGWPQPATPMKTDNITANGIINNTMKQRRSKALDMRFYWLKDRVGQGQFYLFWDSGKNNLADYYTKHHPAAVHKLMRAIHTFVDGKSPTSLQGCIEIMNKGQTGRNPNPSGLIASIRAIG